VTSSEWALIATWVVDEVRVAVEHGYLVHKIHEFYEYEITQYDPKTGEVGHFVQYTDTFLKVTSDASGYPGWVQGPQDEDKYVQCFREVKGSSSIRLPSRRTLPRRASQAVPQFVLGQVDGIE
jgi:hypothetical protein